MPKPDTNDFQAIADASPIQSVISAPDYHLVVIHPFDGYAKGQKIENAATIASILSSDNASSCHKVFPK